MKFKTYMVATVESGETHEFWTHLGAEQWRAKKGATRLYYWIGGEWVELKRLSDRIKELEKRVRDLERAK